MSAALEIVSPGAMASIQDLGRPGLRRVGVPRAGALEPGWLRLANALVGNEEAAPAIEFFGGGLLMRALERPVRVALAGHFSATVIAADEQRRVDSWRSVTLAPGETLRCATLAEGRLGYVALAGISVRRQLGSASTYARAGLGGLDGRLLGPGDRLAAAACSGAEKMLKEPPPVDPSPIRVVLGPQDDYFDEASIARLLSEAYQVSAAADRMGIRLDGPRLGHRPEKGVEITSDATVPGSIQVPGQGQPIVLLADGQTAGGYPKVATVISADLPRLAVMAPGQTLRFVAVSVPAAEFAARTREAALQALIAGIGALAEPGALDLQAIYDANLVSGVVDAQADDGTLAASGKTAEGDRTDTMGDE
ncbi:MAG TPA: biotin-dependent carboxyltransferase family protein [Accumulibacter sp.]|uniref:5-oxoprolinase subunit C family protein n=2 Tax=Accumulibacter sp. TaxID=2053492 RepID=UPI000EDF9BF8|nr:biotin-dependent carboxyltransferase family protein [Accumulibacter sp.]HCZ14738.1 urea amidolyase [Accumulibacter sp.]HRF73329.1 biotin-dependent carboxyltransferase family protein [Accumulibacter sp.]